MLNLPDKRILGLSSSTKFHIVLPENRGGNGGEWLQFNASNTAGVNLWS
jgi:hypothetical protein